MNIQQISRNDREYFVVEPEGTIDKIAVNMMEHNRIDSLLSFAYVRQESREYFRYEKGEGISLSEWLSSPHYKSDVMQVLGYILGVERNIAAYMLKDKSLCIDHELVFIDKGKAKLIYIPEIEECGEGILHLLRNIVFSVKYPLDDEYSYLFDIQNAFGRGDIKRLSDFAKWMQIANHEIEIDEDGLEIVPDDKNEADSLPVQNISSENVGNNQSVQNGNEISPKQPQQTPVSSLQKNVKKEATEKNSQVKDVFAEFGINIDSAKPAKSKPVKAEKNENKEQKKGFGGLFGKKSKTDEEPVAPVVIQNVEDIQKPIQESKEIVNVLNDESSTVLESEGPVLVRVRDGFRFNITDTNCVIGTKPDCNIVLSGNPTISKHHIRIFQNERGFILSDLGSTNGTWVNEERVMQGNPVSISNGFRIRISNEEFMFEV